MYSWEKSLREEKSRKNPKNPSFSSSLLDEIYRSIDGNDEKSSEELRVYRERSVNKYSYSSSNGGGVRTKVEDEEVASLKRACMIEKWMDKKVNDKVSSRRRPSSLPEMDNKSLLHDNDPLFFSSTSSSSDSSSGGLSSSDTEFFSSSRTSRKSCFAAPWPKPVRTSVSKQQGYEFHTFDDYQNQQATKDQEGLIKSKSRALKIYANLKKVKQPISPGGRLTSFINSLFTNGNTKKSSKDCSRNRNGGGSYEDANTERKSKSTQASTCSSASSFSRSCLSKTPPSSRGKLTDAGTKRTVTFYPVSVIVDEDCRPCGHKCIYDADSIKYGRPPLPQNAKEQKLNQIQNNSTRKIEGVARESLRTYQNQKKDIFTIAARRTITHDEIEEDDENDYDYDDAASDSSSDLFEIDHLSLFANNRFREELPVYETTHLDTNLAIASGLIR